MLLNKLTISNFGVFENSVEIDLSSPSKDKPLIIIHGKNGAGKTTILEAIRVALYGPRLLGVRTTTESYLRRIQMRLNRTATANPTSRYFVALSLTVAEQGILNEYVITREWRRLSPQLLEEVSVTRNGIQLKGKKASDFEDFIRRFLPLGAFDMLFLDGERLNELFDGDSFTREVGRALLPLCGLDVYGLLDADLDTYLRSENTFETLDQDQRNYQKRQEHCQTLAAEKSKVKDELSQVEMDLTENRAALSAFEKDLRNYGVKETANHLQRLSKLEQQRKELNETTKAFVADVLPFIVSKSLLKQTVSQMEEEETLDRDKQIRDYIKSPHVRQHLAKTLGVGFESKVDAVVNALVTLPSESNSIAYIHGLSREQAAGMVNLWVQIREGSFDLVFDQIAATTAEIAELKRDSALVEDAEVATLLENIKKTSMHIAELVNRKVLLEERFDDLEKRLTVAQADRDRAATAVFRSKRDENVFMITHRAKEAVSEFMSIVLNDYSAELANKTTKHLLAMLRKQRFVSKVEVDPTTLQLRMYDESNRMVDPLGLSAGEKQLLVLSALWSLLEISHRQLPLVFDTLIGRLDATHKTNVLTETLPSISEQVILLATDTEIDKEDYEALKPYVGRVLQLDYQDEAGNTVLREGNPYEL